MNLYLLSLTEAAKLPEEQAEAAFPIRMTRARRFRRREDFLRCLGAGFLLHSVLKIPEKDLRFTPCGKPYVSEGPGFSLSHAGNYVLLAVQDKGQVGADIEVPQQDFLSVMDRVYTPEEIQWLLRDPLPRFFKLWALKESVIKFFGKSAEILPEFSVLPLLRGETLPLWGSSLHAQSQLYDGHWLACCCAEPFPQLFPVLLHVEEL